MAESKLLPPEKRTIEVSVRQGGVLVLEAKFYESGGWHEVVPIPFADFAPTLTCMADLEKLVAIKGRYYLDESG